MDPIRSTKKDHHRPSQDGDDGMVPSLTLESQPETEVTPSHYSDAPVSEKWLYTMLQDLWATIHMEIKQITVELKRELFKL
ncbi:Hypothetical predicted protein, partial [Pelobates cultripes]